MPCHAAWPRLRAFVVTAFLALGVPQVAAAQAYWNTELLGRFARGSRDAYAAVWGYTAPDGTEIAIIGTVDGTSFVDATDPRHLVEVGFVRGPSSSWREMQTHDHYAYIVTEGGGGMQIVDLADPQDPVLAATYIESFNTAHTIHIRDGFAYVNGTNIGLRILDLADPVQPVEVGVWDTRYTHDSFVRGDILYACNINSGGFTSVDVSDRAQPRELRFTPYPGAATHNAWSTEDGRHLLTTDETTGGHLRIWNVANPAAPDLVAEWSAEAAASIHNVVVKGDSAYIAYYTEGLQVVDISNPTSPLQVAYYDTWPGLSGGFRGNWGVYPFARNGNIYLSDIEGGLFVVRMSTGGAPVLDFRLAAPPSRLVTPGQSQILFFFDLFNGASGTRVFDLTATNNAGWPISVQPQIQVPRTGTEAVLVTVQVPQALLSPLRVDVELCARSRTTTHSACVQTKIAVPVTLQSLVAAPHAGGIDVRWRLVHDGETGALVVARAAAGGPFETRARLDLDAEHFQDADVVPGTAYDYRLGLETPDGARVLGEVHLEVAAPARSRLLGNAPNPFNPSTSVRFELVRPGDVTLDVHDVRGRLVRRLAAAGLAPGVHALAWDGRDDRGRPQPSGVYPYEIRSHSWRERGRMTLVR